MDFGLVDSLVCSSSATSASNNGSSLFSLDNNDTNNKQRCYGFEFLKQGRATNVNEDGFRDFNKVTKISSLQRSDDCNLTDGHQQMLSFSSPSSQAMTWPYYHQTSSGFVRNTGGYGSSGINAANMQQGILSGGKGPFTPSQWMELEHQALIYKYITANVPVPSYLLNPIRKAFDSVGFSSFPGLRSNALGWGGFHLGFASNDPEPGRCRRTDGKKWRCSRDAVVDQKYCERHMNRGRHRSRKPVEGQSGHSASGATTTTTGGKTVMSTASNTSMSMVAPAGGASSGLQLSHHHHLSSSSNNHPSGIPNINRSVINKENTDGTYQKTTGLKDNSLLSTTKHHPYSEFGLVYSDSLLNPLDRSSSLVNSKSYNTSDNMDDPKNKSHNPLRQFMDDRTQLSISITSDFMPSASSPTNEKMTASPPWLSRELEMGLGVGPVDTERNQSLHTNWIPISWGPSMGGPLGEVLHTTSNATMDECRNTKPLNLIDAWDNSPRMVSSPTGVLQRSAFGSLSNSSAGSSPRAEICNGLMGLGFMNNPSSPAL